MALCSGGWLAATYKSPGRRVAAEGTAQQAAAQNERNKTTQHTTAQRRAAQHAAARHSSAPRTQHSTAHGNADENKKAIHTANEPTERHDQGHGTTRSSNQQQSRTHRQTPQQLPHSAQQPVTQQGEAPQHDTQHRTRQHGIAKHPTEGQRSAATPDSTRHHSHLQHLPPIPSATQPRQWIPEDTPYTVRDKQYHYPTPIQQLATTLGHPGNIELLRRPEDSVRTPLCYSALLPDSLPAHLQKPWHQLALEQLPLLTRYRRWYARRSIHVPARYAKCICGHTEGEPWDHFKTCPLYRGLDTLTDWNPTHTIAQHAGWPTRSPAIQQLATILKQTEVLEAVRRGLVPTAVYTLLRTHAEDPQATAAHMQRTAVAKTAGQLTYSTHKYLQHAANLSQTNQAHPLKLLFYQP